jgi:hypothetical protein
VPRGSAFRLPTRVRAGVPVCGGKAQLREIVQVRLGEPRAGHTQLVSIASETHGPVAPGLQPCLVERRTALQNPTTAPVAVRDLLDRILTTYGEIDRRFSPAGGLGALLNVYEQVRRELDRVSYEELDRMTQEIKSVIEALLKMDYELRRVHNLKLAFDGGDPGSEPQS